MDWTESAKAILAETERLKQEAEAERTVRIPEELAAEIRRLKSFYEKEAERLDLHRRDLTNVFTTDVANPDGRLEDLTRAERAKVGDSFGNAVGDLNKGIRDARDRRSKELAKVSAEQGIHHKTLDDNRYVIRTFPRMDAPQMSYPKTSLTLPIDVWARGEVLRGNDIWFRVKGSGWIWSGEFRPEDRDPGDLALIHLIVSGPDLGQHARNCMCDQCLPIQQRRNHFAFEMERTLQPALSYADRYEAKLRKEVAEKHARTRIPKGAKLLPPETEEQREALRQIERNRQAAMGYRVGPYPNMFGWRVIVDRHDGRKHVFWRPTKAMAEKTGHKALEKFVLKRQRAFEAANPRLVTAKDRWIVPPTQAEQSAKEQAEWDAQFNEEGKQ